MSRKAASDRGKKENNDYRYSSKVQNMYIELHDYTFYHSPSEQDSLDKRFIGRKRIIQKLKTILTNTDTRSGAYLVTGYRGIGKSSFVNKVLADTDYNRPVGNIGHHYLLLFLLTLALPIFHPFVFLTPPLSFIVGIVIFISIMYLIATDQKCNYLRKTQSSSRFREWVGIANECVKAFFRLLIFKNNDYPTYKFRSAIQDVFVIFPAIVALGFIARSFSETPQEKPIVSGAYIAAFLSILLINKWYFITKKYGKEKKGFKERYHKFSWEIKSEEKPQATDFKTVRSKISRKFARYFWSLVKYKFRKISWGFILYCGFFIKHIFDAIRNYFNFASRSYIKINLGYDDLKEIDILRLIAKNLLINYRRFRRVRPKNLFWKFLKVIIIFFIVGTFYYSKAIYKVHQDIKSQTTFVRYFPSQCSFQAVSDTQETNKFTKFLHDMNTDSTDFQLGKYLETIAVSIKKPDNGSISFPDTLSNSFQGNVRKITIYTDLAFNLAYLKVRENLPYPINPGLTNVALSDFYPGNSMNDNFIAIPEQLDYFFILYLLLFWVGTKYAARYRIFGIPTHESAIWKLQELNDAIDAQITREKGQEISGKRKPFRYWVWRKVIKAYPIADEREIEKRLQDILNNIDKIPRITNRPEFVIILDELDKIEPHKNITIYEKEQEEASSGNRSYSVFSTTDGMRKRQHVMFKILANLKHFLNTAKVKFIFIAGREMYDAALADVSDRNFFIGSIFHDVIYVDSFFSDETDRKIPDITSMTETYVCQFLLPVEYAKYGYSLKVYNKYLKENFLDEDSLLDEKTVLDLFIKTIEVKAIEKLSALKNKIFSSEKELIEAIQSVGINDKNIASFLLDVDKHAFLFDVDKYVKYNITEGGVKGIQKQIISLIDKKLSSLKGKKNLTEQQFFASIQPNEFKNWFSSFNILEKSQEMINVDDIFLQDFKQKLTEITDNKLGSLKYLFFSNKNELIEKAAEILGFSVNNVKSFFPNFDKYISVIITEAYFKKIPKKLLLLIDKNLKVLKAKEKDTENYSIENFLISLKNELFTNDQEFITTLKSEGGSKVDVERMLEADKLKRYIEQLTFKRDILRQKRQKIIFTLQNFIIYLTYRSNGAPKKITRFFEHYVIEAPPSPKFPREDHQGITIGKNRRNLYLLFRFNHQYTFEMINYMVNPFLLSLNRTIKEFGDKLLVSVSFLLDHFYKFHGQGFSWRSLELMPEIVDINKAPQLRELIGRLIHLLSNTHIYEILNGLYNYKFRKRISEEIKYLSKISEQEAAAFNFTLDESLAIKRHHKRLLRELETKYEKNPGIDQSNYNYIHSISFIRMILGDLHFYDKEFDNAILEYMEAVQSLRAVDKEQMDLYKLILLVRYMLKLGHTFEKKKTFDSAFMIYGKLSTLIMESLEKQNLLNNVSDPKNFPYTYNSKQPGFIRTGKEAFTVSVFEGIRLIYQPFIARFQIIEKGNLGSITYTDILRLENEFTTLIRSINQQEKFLISAEFYNKMGNTLYYKNGVMPKGEGKEDKKGIPFCCTEQNMCSKNPAIKEIKNEGCQLPCRACEYYHSSLKTLAINYLQINFDEFKIVPKEPKVEKNQIFIELLEVLNEKKYIHRSTTALQEVAKTLSNIGDTFLSCAPVGQIYEMKAELDNEYLGNFLEIIDNNNDYNAAINKLKEYQAKKKEGLNKLEEALLYYFVSSLYYRNAGEFKESVFQLTKILYTIRDYLAIDTKTSLLRPRELLNRLGDAILDRSIRRMYRTYQNTHRLEIEKFSDTFEPVDPEGEAHKSAKAYVILQNISLNVDIEENLVIYDEIRLKKNPASFSMAKNFATPYAMINSFYNRIHVLRFKSALNYSFFRRLILERLKGDASEISDSEALEAFNYTMSEARFRKILKDDDEIRDMLKEIFLDEEIDARQALEFLITDSIFCLHELIKFCNVFGVTYMCTHSMIASAHKKLADWCHYYFVYLHLCNRKNKGKEDKYKDGQAYYRIRKKLEELIGLSDVSTISPNYHYEMALKHFRSATETHREGKAYRQIIEEMNYLNDDFDDNLYHFCAATERLRINSGKIRNAINSLRQGKKKDKTEKTMLYDYELYRTYEPKQRGERE